jgi:hypothetical protein
MKTDLLHHRRTCLSGRGQRVLHRFLFGHQLRSSPERRFTQKARWSTDGLPVIKTASAFGLYGVLISRTWTDGGGKRSPSTANAILRPLPYRALCERTQGRVATQTQRGQLPPTQLLRVSDHDHPGRAYWHGRGESVTRSDRRRCELRFKSSSPPLTRPCQSTARERPGMATDTVALRAPTEPPQSALRT